MQTRRIWRWLAAIAAATLLLGACGDSDGDDGASGTGTESESGSGSGDSGENVLRVEMKDYAYGVEGELKEGPFRLETENTGDEFHMIGLAKLKDGVDIADVAKGLAALGGPGGGEEDGGGEDGSEDDSNQSTTTAGRNTSTTRASRAQSATTTTTSRSGASTTSTTAGEEAQSGPAEGEGGEEGGDPFAEFFEGEEIGAPGHLLMPGQSQAITMEEGLEPGSYAMICFLPGEGDGTPHFAKGMIGAFDVAEGEGELELPEADATYTLSDNEKPDGPAELEAGEVTVEVKAEGEAGHDFFIGTMKDGKSFSDFDTYFQETFEGESPAPKGAAKKAPGVFEGSVFEIKPGTSLFMTVELEKGEAVIVNTTNTDDEEEDSEDQVLEVTVT